MKLTPRPYQKKGIKFLEEKNGGALFLRPSAGKTAMILEWLKKILKKKPDEKFLLIANLQIMYDAWEYEPLKWTKNIKVCNIHRDGYQEGYNLYLINPARFSIDFKKSLPYIRTFNGLIVDESTVFKNATSGRSQQIMRFIDVIKPEYTAIATGTPITKNLLNLFSQFYIIDKSILGRDFFQFRSIFFEPTPDGYGWLPRAGAEEEIIKRVSRKAFIISAEDEKQIGYPEVIENDLYFSLTEKTRKQYDKLHRDFILEMEERVVDKTKHKGQLYSGAVGYNYCSQFTCGNLYRVDKTKTVTLKSGKTVEKVVSVKPEYIHSERLDVVQNLIEVLDGEPLLAAYHYNFDIDMIKRLKLRNIEFIGRGVKPAKVQEIIKEWNKGNIKVLFCQIASISHGLNLQFGGNHVLFYNVPHDYEQYYQAYHRLVRSGQKSNTVTIHRIICRNTVDEIKRLQILEEKTLTAVDFKKQLERMIK